MKKNKALTHLFHHSFEAERNLRQFSTASSTELSAMLATVVAELEFALALKDAAERERSIRLALNAAEQAIHTSRNLKYFAASTRLDLQATDLSQLVLDCVDQVEGVFQQVGIQFNVVVESGIYAVLDAAAVAQAISNLLWFSYFCLAKGGKLAVALQVSSTKIEISVGHDGLGFHPEQVERLFDPLSREQIGQDRGLGLMVTKSIVESHGGEVAVHSAAGKGTNFFLSLPVTAANQRAPLHAEKRRHRRVPVQLATEVQFPDQRPLRARLTTLSIGGCFVAFHPGELRETPKINSHFSLKILCQGNELIAIPKARVASVVPTGSYMGFGVEFLEVDDRGQKLLRALVKSQG